ncbi:MAG TPA: DEAD/DEAH box helicase, partial [Planctomycetaceae bacterium]|nr:DEAD/DEAH box helicase [Planctomycetaceae bacterium]
GTAEQRAVQYDADCFFSICNYEQVLRDLDSIEPVAWDLIILDEGQRIKNWESKTACCIKALRSPFALVLSGTPLENRLAELYSVVQFVDDRHLPPAYRFFHRHREVDERGKVLGYKNMAELRKLLEPILLRRTRASVLQQLPERTTHIVRIPPTEEQQRMCGEFMTVAARIANKKFLTEMDLLRLQKALLQARMACDSTFLVDKTPPGFSSKLEYFAEMCESLFADPTRKAVLFSEWTTMLDLIEPILKRQGLRHVRLDGSVPQRKRPQLIRQFQNDPDCRLFLTTNAGSTGLNLQAANTVINMDLPWNPAVLEQRIARAHRMGQKDPVDVYLLVTEQTFEERLLDVLAQKQTLSLAVLDPDSDVDRLDFQNSVEELRRKLEVLLGPAPIAPLAKASRRRAETEMEQAQRRREKVAAAGGQLLGAVFEFVGELVGQQDSDPPKAVVESVRAGLEQCVERDARGEARLVFRLPDETGIEQLAKTLARLLLPDSAPHAEGETGEALSRPRGETGERSQRSG